MASPAPFSQRLRAVASYRNENQRKQKRRICIHADLLSEPPIAQLGVRSEGLYTM